MQIFADLNFKPLEGLNQFRTRKNFSWNKSEISGQGIQVRIGPLGQETATESQHHLPRIKVSLYSQISSEQV